MLLKMTHLLSEGLIKGGNLNAASAEEGQSCIIHCQSCISVDVVLPPRLAPQQHRRDPGCGDEPQQTVQCAGLRN